MDVKTNAMSYSKNLPILKPSHDTILGINQIELFDKKLNLREFNYLVNNTNKEIVYTKNMTLKDIFY